MNKKALKRWLAARPPQVRALLTEFPFGTLVEMPDSGPWFVIGADEGGMLIISPLWPAGQDYQRAMDARRRICAVHLRAGEVAFAEGHQQH